MSWHLEMTEQDIEDIKKWMYVYLEHGSVAETLYQKLVKPDIHDVRKV